MSLIILPQRNTYETLGGAVLRQQYRLCVDGKPITEWSDLPKEVCAAESGVFRNFAQIEIHLEQDLAYLAENRVLVLDEIQAPVVVRNHHPNVNVLEWAQKKYPEIAPDAHLHIR